MMHSALRSAASLPSLLLHPLAGRRTLVRYRNRRLRHLLAHSYRYVPYYRRCFDEAGIRPADIRSPEDLVRLPITTKETLQSLAPEDILTRGLDPRTLIQRKTSGATGEAVVIHRTWAEERLLQMIRHRAFHLLGGRPTDRVAAVSLERAPHPRDHQFLDRAVSKFGLYQRSVVDCRQPSERILASLQRLRPDILRGFAGAVAHVAAAQIDSQIGPLRPRMVITGAEVLTAHMRETVSAAFGAPVYETYGSHEFNLIGWQCRHSGDFHTADDGLIVEVLHNGRPAAENQRGEIVATNLHAFAMPFIRYRLGDLVTQGAQVCSCGSPFGTLRSIQGRMLDYFPLADGRMLHPYEIFRRVKRSAGHWIRRYQLVQESETRIVMTVVGYRDIHPDRLGEIAAAIRSVVGDSASVDVRLANRIADEPNGKFRVAKSLVASSYGTPAAAPEDV